MKTSTRIRAVLAGVAAAGLAIGLSACGDPTADPVEELEAGDNQTEETDLGDETILIGGSIFTLQYPWFVGAQQGMEEWAADHPEADVKFQFEDSNQDIQTNIKNLEDLAAAGAKGIVVFPTDSKAIIPTIVDLAKEKDIAFVVGDYPQQPDNPEDAVWKTFVGHDMVALGEASGEVAVESLKEMDVEDPTLVYITVPTSGETSDQRFKGFSEVVLAEFPDANIIEEGDTGAADRNSAQSLMENILQREDTVHVVAGHNDAEVLGAYNAALGANRAEDMRFIGIGGDKEVLQYIDEGNESWAGGVIQDPVVMGYTAMEALWSAMIDGAELPEVYELPEPVAITPDNIDEHDWKNWDWLG